MAEFTKHFDAPRAPGSPCIGCEKDDQCNGESCARWKTFFKESWKKIRQEGEKVIRERRAGK